MNGKLVYLLEDDPDLRHVLRIILSRSGYEVVSFPTAQGFNQQMELKHPNLCILDVNLPDGNGMDICFALTSALPTSHIPVLLMSANFYSRDKYHTTGARDFISKPFDIAHLLELVAKFI